MKLRRIGTSAGLAASLLTIAARVMAGGEDPSTEELRVAQAKREATERHDAESSETEDEAKQHARRAEKSGYLKEKLAEREKSERETED